MEPISPTDAMFLIGESREHPMHVGSLQLFEPPEDAGPHFVREAYQAMLECTDVQPSFRKHPSFFGGITNVAWSFDKDVELDYHLRRSALPEPGRVRDLLELASRLHGSLLDRHRPMWEAHLIEGLQDGRYAVYTKYHHSLMDGVSALRLMQRAFTPDPHDDEVRVPWSLGPRKRSGRGQQSSLLDRVGRTAGSALAFAPSTLKLARAALLEQQLTLPFRAPRSMFNGRIGGARRVAAQSYSLERIKAVKSATGATINDVVLAMSAGALRAYLIEQDALPEPAGEVVLDLEPGPRADWFTAGAVEALDGATYAVAADSNRVGLRLSGPAIEHDLDEELPSEGMVLGAVQVPPSGQPVVFLHDHHTTGGYPVVAVVVVLLGGGVTAAVLLSRGDHKHRSVALPPDSGVPSAPAVPGQSAPGPLPSSAPTSAPPSAPAKVPGWRAVVSVKHGVTYDVPPDWKVLSPTTIVGFEDAHGRPEVAGSGAADYKEGYCQGHSGSWRAQAAVTGYITTDLAADAADAARKWGTYAYTPDNGQAPAVSLSPAKAIDAGGTPAQEVTATVTLRDHSDPCNPPRGIVHAVATTLKNGKVSVLVVMADQGVGDAANDADLLKIAGSLRRTP